MRAAGAWRRPRWPAWRARTRMPPNGCWRRSVRRSVSTRASAAACSTRSRCGRWPPTCRIRRAAWPTCRPRPTTPACTNGGCARPSPGATGPARWRDCAACPPGNAAIRAGPTSKRGCASSPATLPGPGPCSRRPRPSRISTASSPPTASTSRMRCARGCRPPRRPRSRRSPAIRPWCARCSWSRWTAAAGRNANGTTRYRG